MLEIAGIGPGSIDNMTIGVYKAIKNAEVVIAFGRVGESVKCIRNDIVLIKSVIGIENHIDRKKDTLILASGDPCFYGITNYILNLGLKVDKIHSGISSFQVLMAKLQMPWQDAHLFSLHGRDYSLELLQNYKLSIGLTDRDNTPSKISKELFNMGIKGKIVAAYNLSYKDELIEEKNIGETFSDKSALAIVVVQNELA